jgi:hypothetical protein
MIGTFLFTDEDILLVFLHRVMLICALPAGASPGEGTGATMSDDEDNQVDSESNMFDGNEGSDGMGFGPLMLTEGERSLVERVRQELKHELKQVTSQPTTI